MKDSMATGKRSQVARLVCEPLLIILSLVTYRIFEKYLVVEMFSWHWVGSQLLVAGLWLRFQVAGYMKLVGRELACKNSHLSLLLTTWDVWKEEPLGLSDRNSILMKNIFHKYCLFSYRSIARHYLKLSQWTMVYNSTGRTHSAYNEIWIGVFIRSSHTERMLQTNETVLQNFDLGSCLCTFVVR